MEIQRIHRLTSLGSTLRWRDISFPIYFRSIYVIEFCFLTPQLNEYSKIINSGKLILRLPRQIPRTSLRRPTNSTSSSHDPVLLFQWRHWQAHAMSSPRHNEHVHSATKVNRFFTNHEVKSARYSKVKTFHRFWKRSNDKFRESFRVSHKRLLSCGIYPWLVYSRLESRGDSGPRLFSKKITETTGGMCERKRRNVFIAPFSYSVLSVSFPPCPPDLLISRSCHVPSPASSPSSFLSLSLSLDASGLLAHNARARFFWSRVQKPRRACGFLRNGRVNHQLPATEREGTWMARCSCTTVALVTAISRDKFTATRTHENARKYSWLAIYRTSVARPPGIRTARGHLIASIHWLPAISCRYQL